MAKVKKGGLAAMIGAGAAGILLGVASNTGFTERFEGMVLKGYLDPVGIPTKCAGDTYGVELGKRYTLEECKVSLENGLMKHAEPVLKCAPQAVKDNPFFLAASIDLSYHMGLYCDTSINKEFKAGNYKTACERFNKKPSGEPQFIFVKDKFDKVTQKWSYKPLPGLVKRAAARRELCEKGLTYAGSV